MILVLLHLLEVYERARTFINDTAVILFFKNGVTIESTHGLWLAAPPITISRAWPRTTEGANSVEAAVPTSTVRQLTYRVLKCPSSRSALRERARWVTQAFGRERMLSKWPPLEAMSSGARQRTPGRRASRSMLHSRLNGAIAFPRVTINEQPKRSGPEPVYFIRAVWHHHCGCCLFSACLAATLKGDLHP